MTATLPPAIDPHGATATTSQHNTSIGTVLDSLEADCTELGIRIAELSAGAQFEELHATVYLPLGDTDGVDTLAQAYGLPPAGFGDGPYDRVGPVTVQGRPVRVRIMCARPPQTPALPVASERADVLAVES